MASGHRNSGWISNSLTLPLRPSVSTPTEANICLTRDSSALVAGVLGETASKAHAATSNGTPLPGRLRIEYLTRGQRSWLSLANKSPGDWASPTPQAARGLCFHCSQ